MNKQQTKPGADPRDALLKYATVQSRGLGMNRVLPPPEFITGQDGSIYICPEIRTRFHFIFS